MQILVSFTELKDDGLNHIIGEKIFNDATDKEEIESFIKNAFNVFKQTRSNPISYVVYQRESENNPWGIPVNRKTLKNEC